MWETAKQFSIFPQCSGVVPRHHPPDEAGQFPCNCGLGNIAFGAQSDTVKFAPESFVGFVCVGHDLRWAAGLPGLQRRCFFPHCTPAILLCRLNEKPAQMRVPRFCDAGVPLLLSAGVFPWYKAQVGRKLLRGRKPPEVPYFATEGQGGMVFYPYETAQFFNRLPIRFTPGQFLNAFIVCLHFLLRLVVQREIFFQNLVEHTIAKIQSFQPIQMPFCPIRFPVILLAVSVMK